MDATGGLFSKAKNPPPANLYATGGCETPKYYYVGVEKNQKKSKKIQKKSKNKHSQK